MRYRFPGKRLLDAFVDLPFALPTAVAGIALTAIYAPKDQSQKYPIMLYRTPYSVSPYGPNAYRNALGPSNLFQQEKFIFFYQDVRGK